MSANLSASVLARLHNLAKQRGEDYNQLLNRFALERILHRISLSAHANNFLLKGALLFSLWYDQPHRPTRDADFLGFGTDDADHLIATFKEITGIDLEDGIVFEPDSVRVEAIREDNFYGGLRVRVLGYIGKARCPLQLDVGFGDAVTPAPETVAYPTLLSDFASPTLRAYPVYTAIAEKYQAMVLLGLANTRMKDFYDVSVIAKRTELDGALLAKAIGATFARRTTALPTEPPLALTEEFGSNADKQRQWQAFLRRNGLAASTLLDTVTLLNALLWPPTQVALASSDATARWHPHTVDWQEK